MDEEAYQFLSNHKEFKDHVVYSSGAEGGATQNIWQKRIDTILKFLQEGINVFVADVDSIWLKKVDLSDLPINVDIFHGDGSPFPHDIYWKWEKEVEGLEKGFTF